jgi:hypothetical protein
MPIALIHAGRSGSPSCSPFCNPSHPARLINLTRPKQPTHAARPVEEI